MALCRFWMGVLNRQRRLLVASLASRSEPEFLPVCLALTQTDANFSRSFLCCLLEVLFFAAAAAAAW